MTHHEHKGDHQGHAHHHGRKPIHKDWRAWLVVGLMLAAMLLYVMTLDEAIQPGGQPGEPMPAAPPPPAGV